MILDKEKELKEAEKRLEEQMPIIRKRHREAAKNLTDEPRRLRSGISLSELDIKRILKEQDNED